MQDGKQPLGDIEPRLFFQVPRLPEALLGGEQVQADRHVLARPSRSARFRRSVSGGSCNNNNLGVM